MLIIGFVFFEVTFCSDALFELFAAFVKLVLVVLEAVDEELVAGDDVLDCMLTSGDSITFNCFTKTAFFVLS